jgi:hypothetical protein
MKTRIARIVVLLMVSGSVIFGGIALAAGNGNNGPKPGKGCGDKQHVHYRAGECHDHGPGH